MNSIETVLIQCPHCWEMIEHNVDCTVAEQQYIEDCSVCCQPINILVEINDRNEIRIEALQE